MGYGAREQWMIDRARIELERHHNHALDARAFVLELGDLYDSNGADYLVKMNRSAFIPWPDRQCVVVTVLRSAVNAFYYYGECPRSNGKRPAYFLSFASATDDPDRSPTWCSFILKGDVWNEEQWEASGIQLDKGYASSIIDYQPSFDRTAFTNSVLASFTSLFTPTGYVVQQRSKNPRGTKARRRNPNASTVYRYIGYDRMWTIFKGEGEKMERAPHAVRGHMRHLWKQSGVSLEGLPRDVAERVKLANAKRVRTTYVQPHWWGERHAEDGDFEYDFDPSDVEF